jgi:hypothetical protein
LGEVELVVIRIVGSKTGEGNVTLALDHKNVGIKLLQPVSDGLNVVDLQAEVIEPGGKTRLALQQCEANHTIAEMASFLIVVAILIGHSGGNLLHAEKRLIEVGHAEMVVRMNGDVPDFSKHSNYLLVARILLKDGRICQQRAVQSRDAQTRSIA